MGGGGSCVRCVVLVGCGKCVSMRSMIGVNCVGSVIVRYAIFSSLSNGTAVKWIVSVMVYLGILLLMSFERIVVRMSVGVVSMCRRKEIYWGVDCKVLVSL